MTSAPIEIRPFEADGECLDGIARVYRQALNLDWGGEYAMLKQYAERFAGFRGRVALARGDVVGVGWGTRSVAGEWLYDRVAANAGADHPALQDAWLLVVLAVLEEYRGQGIGSRLHHDLLDAQPCPRALVSTHVENDGARRLYERHGWQYFRPECLVEAGPRRLVVLHQEIDCRDATER
jgi:GNAT superfamily N-acetyltransferase